MMKFQLLFTNHIDAWSVTLMIVSIALFVNDAVTPKNSLLLIAIPLGYWLAFAVNDYFDAPYDAQEEVKGRGNFFVQCQPAKWLLWAGIGVITVIFVLIFRQFARQTLVVLVVCLGVAWMYSAPPFRLKARPGLDLLTHAIFVEAFPYWMTLYFIRAEWVGRDYVLVGFLAVASLAAQLEQQARDFEVDSKTEQNFTTNLGVRRTVRLLKVATGMMGVLLLAGFVTGELPLYLLGFVAIGLPMMAYRLVQGAERPPSRVLRMWTLALALSYTTILWGLIMI